MSQQVTIDSLAFARDGGVLQGRFALADLLRLHDCLAAVSGEVSYRLQGAVSRQHGPQLVLDVSGELPLLCQRCLLRMDFPLAISGVFQLVSDETDVPQDALEDENRDFLVAEKALDVMMLVEDEIILALPVSPRHSACVLPVNHSADGKVLPFAALSALKKNK